MIIFFGQAENDDMGAWLKFVQNFFKEGGVPKPFHRLTKNCFLDLPPGKEKLIVCGHGEQRSLADMGPVEFATKLCFFGLTNTRFESIHLLNCGVALQTQQNGVVENFARAFKSRLAQIPETQGIKIYAPRGQVVWEPQWKTMNGQRFMVATGVGVQTQEREYPFPEGMLLVL